MTLSLFKMTGDKHRMTKTISDGVAYSGSLRNESKITDPNILIETTDNISKYNYAYIDEFGRWYYITEITSIRTGLWEISMHVDVLTTWRDEIMNATAIIDKQQYYSNGSPYLDDNSLMVTVQRKNQSIAFPSGFPDNPNYVLAVAGGIY